uniref:Uncharacterized protein n=1 Tax=Graphocephala atropunctata TaxID=36148 RepID=A0A1B6LCD7_9HEMI
MKRSDQYLLLYCAEGPINFAHGEGDLCQQCAGRGRDKCDGLRKQTDSMWYDYEKEGTAESSTTRVHDGNADGPRRDGRDTPETRAAQDRRVILSKSCVGE